MNPRVTLFFVVLLLNYSPLISQEIWTLNDCISYAIKHSLTLKNNNYDKASSNEDYRQSIRNLLPNISLNSDYNIRYGRSTDPFTNDVTNTDFFSNNYSINTNIDLFEGFKKLNAIRAAKFIYEAFEEELLQEKYLLSFRVMEAYYNILFYKGLLKNSIEQLKISEENYHLVKKQIELGLKAGVELYEVESNLLTDKLSVTKHENLVTSATLKLIQEMNLDSISEIEIEPLTIQEIEYQNKPNRVVLDSLFDRAKYSVPEMKAQQLRLKAAEKNLQRIKGDLYPSLRFFAGYRTGFFETNLNQQGQLIPFSTQIKDNASRFVGVSLNIPISNRWVSRSRVNQQKIAVLRAKNDLAIQEQQLFQLLQELIQNQQALITEKNQIDKKIQVQKLTYKMAQKRYSKGMINSLELFQAKNSYAMAKNESLQTAIRLRMNQSTIDFYNGLPVFNIN